MNKLVSEEIDIIRGTSAIGVIIGHTLYENFHVLNGAFWVWIFFSVSGFLQGNSFFDGKYPLNKHGIKTYWKNRILRIVPLFWLILVLGWGINYRLYLPLGIG